MFIHYRTEGLILKQDDRGEADQLLTIYTRGFGKLKILGRAIRKISSKLRSSAELFYFSEIEFIQGKIYKTLTDAVLVDSFKSTRKNLTKLSIAFKIANVFDKLVKGEEPDEKLWQLLKETFQRLDGLKIGRLAFVPKPGLGVNKLKTIYYYFFWKLVSLLGYRPEFYNCLQCRKGLLPEKLYFSAKEGGIICQNCFKGVKLESRGQEIDIETIKILRIILERGWPIFAKLKIENSHLKPLKEISNYYFSEVLKQAE